MDAVDYSTRVNDGNFKWMMTARWCPSSLAKLVHITPTSLGHMVDIPKVNGIVNQRSLRTGGAPSCGGTHVFFGNLHFKEGIYFSCAGQNRYGKNQRIHLQFLTSSTWRCFFLSAVPRYHCSEVPRCAFMRLLSSRLCTPY